MLKGAMLERKKVYARTGTLSTSFLTAFMAGMRLGGARLIGEGAIDGGVQGMRPMIR